MHFVHRSYEKGQTIAAIATAPGEGAIAIIRISGLEAMTVAETVFSKSLQNLASHTAHYGKILNEDGQTIDEVLVLLMRGKNSFTGEDTVEVHCHGGSLITKRVFERIISAGARPALPGEFSFKAFQNGKLDLSRAEAVQQMIAAKNDLALVAAKDQLAGQLEKKIRSFQKRLFDIAAILEAWVDFPEEGLEFASMEEILDDLQSIHKQISYLKETFQEGRVLHEGLNLALLGSPNVGKSSLLNALAGKDRAIVTSIAGTTRDVLEEQLIIAGLNCKLADTAGIRDTDEVIEKEGIKRSLDTAEKADLVLFVLDGSRNMTIEESNLMNRLSPDKTIVIWNKIDIQTDLLPELNFPFTVKISAKEGSGLEDLKQMISNVIWKKGPPSKEEITITNSRHYHALSETIKALQSLIHGLEEGISPEFLSMEMRACLKELGTIIGIDVTEDILSAIFSKFCVGK